MAKVLVSNGKIAEGTAAYENINNVTFRVFGTSARGIETRNITVPIPNKSTHQNSFDRLLINGTIYANWDAQKIAKEQYGYEKITDCVLIG